MLTTDKFKKIIESYNVQCKFSHFSEQVKPPFMLWGGPFSENFYADGVVYFSKEYYEVELYTRIDTHSEEKALEDYFNTNSFNWKKDDQEWLDEYKLYVTTYIIYG